MPSSANAARAPDDEPTPNPESEVRPSEPGRVTDDPRGALLAYFEKPSPEAQQMEAAWSRGLALYGDEDSDAWIAALEDGTHPLCRIAPGAKEQPAPVRPI